jgi:hypothetical protein
MRILGPIVESFVLAMFDVKAHLRPRSAVRTQLIRDHHARRRAGGFQELLHEPLGSARVSLRRWIKTSRTKPFWSTARQSQCCSPAIEITTSSRCHLSPRVGARSTDPIGEQLAEFPSPLAHGFIGHANATRRQHFLDQAQA